MEQYRIIQSLADAVSYSAKTNYEVAKILESDANCFFSIHSVESIDCVSDKKRIWFLAQAWTFDEIKRLVERGIENFIVDNTSDLDALLSFLSSRDCKVSLLLRMKLKENTIHTGKHFVFGMHSEEVNRLIPGLRKNPKISSLGIHFHRKTQNLSEWSLRQELEDSLSKESLLCIDTVNIGGGIPVRYKNFSVDTTARIFAEINQLRQWLNSKKIRMIIEPGRFLAAPCIKLETNIRLVYGDSIIVDASVYNSEMDTFVANIKLEIEGEKDSGQAFTVKGQTPCSMDIFRYRVFLSNPRAGDKIVFINAGAYNFSSDFCSLRKLDTVIVD